MRYIDADILKEKILAERDKIPLEIVERYSFGVPTPNRHGQSMRGGIRVALRCMEETPTVKIEERRHGNWEIHGYRKDRKRYTIRQECSICHFESDSKTKYCPNCGADMRGESE